MIPKFEKMYPSLERNSSDIHYDMNEPWGHYAKWNKPVAKKQILLWVHLWVPRVVKFIETKGKMVVGRGSRKQGTGNCCWIDRVLVLQDKQLWRLVAPQYQCT